MKERSEFTYLHYKFTLRPPVATTLALFFLLHNLVKRFECLRYTSAMLACCLPLPFIVIAFSSHTFLPKKPSPQNLFAMLLAFIMEDFSFRKYLKFSMNFARGRINCSHFGLERALTEMHWVRKALEPWCKLQFMCEICFYGGKSERKKTKTAERQTTHWSCGGGESEIKFSSRPLKGRMERRKALWRSCKKFFCALRGGDGNMIN